MMKLKLTLHKVNAVCVCVLPPAAAYIKKICHAEDLCKCRSILLLALLYIHHIVTKMLPGQWETCCIIISDQHNTVQHHKFSEFESHTAICIISNLSYNNFYLSFPSH